MEEIFQRYLTTLILWLFLQMQKLCILTSTSSSSYLSIFFIFKITSLFWSAGLQIKYHIWFSCSYYTTGRELWMCNDFSHLLFNHSLSNLSPVYICKIFILTYDLTYHYLLFFLTHLRVYLLFIFKRSPGSSKCISSTFELLW